MIKSKRCPECKKTKGASMFYQNKGRPDGLGAQCIVCMTIRNEIYRHKKFKKETVSRLRKQLKEALKW